MCAIASLQSPGTIARSRKLRSALSGTRLLYGVVRPTNLRGERDPPQNENQRLTFRCSADVLPLFETSSYSTTCPSLRLLRPARSTAGIAPVDVELGKEALPALSR